MPPLFRAYHNANAAQHQAWVNTLAPEGYNPISLSVYGDPSNALYAAVWVQGPSPAWLALHNVDGAGYQNWINTQVEPQGYRVAIVSVTGSGNNLVFAALAIKDGAGWVARHGMTDGDGSDPNSFVSWQNTALGNGMILTSVAIYGSPAARTYAATWETNAGTVQWSWIQNVDQASYQNYFNGFTMIPTRPAYTAVSSDARYVGLFRNDSIGPWISRHGLSSSQYQAAFDQYVAEGYYPICVQGGGTTANPVFAAIFAQQGIIARRWSVTGKPVPSLAKFDAAMKNFMETNGIHSGELAILHNGKLELSRAYTWGEPGYPITEPTSLFRLASCSKTFTCAAITNLYNAKLVSPGTTVFPLLGINSAALPSQTPSPYINSITVQELVDHAGGWNDTTSGFDPVFRLRDIAKDLGLARPPTKMEVARYMYGAPLQFQPGTQNFNTNNKNYSNFGYLLLGLVIEAVTGMPYVDYVRQTVLAPLGLNNVHLSRMTAGPVAGAEVSYDEPNVGPTPVDWASNAMLPNAYGGEGFLTDTMDSGGGLMTTAQTMATLINKYAVWGLNGRAAGSARSGSMDGTTSWAESRGDGVDWAMVFNTRWQLGRVVGTDSNGNNITVLSQFQSQMDQLMNGVTWP
jgi:CubicO group peptidase (beta-lactamase class C family)